MLGRRCNGWYAANGSLAYKQTPTPQGQPHDPKRTPALLGKGPPPPGWPTPHAIDRATFVDRPEDRCSVKTRGRVGVKIEAPISSLDNYNKEEAEEAKEEETKNETRVATDGAAPQLSTLNPEPSILNPKHKKMNPEPRSLNPEP